MFESVCEIAFTILECTQHVVNLHWPSANADKFLILIKTLEVLLRGVNRGTQIRRSVVFLGPIRPTDLIFVQIRIRVTLKIFRGI